ncbi:MAG: tetratricopeptide repeat-containing glycosyltransferase family protein [Candidatus Sulfotelmatobacter sp.]|jgi:tetratricopeptide (TPR) repeat protein
MNKESSLNRAKPNGRPFVEQPYLSRTQIQKTSPSIPALLERALQHHRARRLAAAQQIYRRILTIDPHHADTLHLLGMIGYGMGDKANAIEMIRAAIAISPNQAAYHSNLGTILHAQELLAEAAECYQKAIALKPDLAEAHYNLGNLFHAQDKLTDAIACFEHALALNPTLAEIHYNLGNALQSQNKFEEAIQCYKRALTLDRGKYEALHNWGNALQAQGKLEEAMACYERVLRILPGYAKAHYSVGCALQALGKPDEAIVGYRRARSLRPDFAQAAFSESLAQLLQGNYAEGWQNFDWRWQTKDHNTPMRNYQQPLWRGAKLSSGPVLIWGEQGIGDEIMFAGLMPDAIRTGNDFILDCDPRLQPLFARSFPEIKIVARRPRANENNPEFAFAAHLPAGSLPGLFRAAETAFTLTTSPYLIADPVARDRFRNRYRDTSRPRLAGIAWYTNSRNSSRSRSIDLAVLTPLFAIPDIRWISLQYGDHEALGKQLAAAQAPVVIDRNVDQFRDIDLFAAQVAVMDFVVTIDNSTAHLAAALGVTTFVLLPFAADWRWLRKREDSPWYPAMRLFRQPERGDWNSVVQRVRSSL